MSRVLPLGLCLAAAVGCASPPTFDVGLAATPDAPADEVLRFIVTGDTGKGNAVERRVARSMSVACAARGGCRFALLVGDNVYENGPQGVDDPELRTKFEEPFAPDPFPFWVALGNHDYGGGGAGWDFWKARDEIAWSHRDPKWRMPARHYAFTDAHADFFALDTTALFWMDDDAQTSAFEARLQVSARPWRIAFGHHPYLSNGRHGDAGHYDRVPSWMPGSGERWRRFFAEHVCHHVDAYFAGHDHTMQDLGEHCGVQLFVSGAGSSPTKLRRHHRGLFEASGPGFAMVELTATRMRVSFYDAAAHELWNRTIEHTGGLTPR